MSRLRLEATQLTFQWVSAAVNTRTKRADYEAKRSFHLLQNVRMSGVVRSLLTCTPYAFIVCKVATLPSTFYVCFRATLRIRKSLTSMLHVLKLFYLYK